MTAVSLLAVNHDGQGGLVNHRKVDVQVNIDLATLPGPHGFGIVLCVLLMEVLLLLWMSSVGPFVSVLYVRIPRSWRPYAAFLVGPIWKSMVFLIWSC